MSGLSTDFQTIKMLIGKWPYYVPLTTPVLTDFLYLPPVPENLEDIYAGRHANLGKSLIILKNNVSQQFLSSLTYRNRLTRVVILLKQTAYTWFAYDPSYCHSLVKPLVAIGSCANLTNLYPEKVPLKLGGCPVVQVSNKEIICPPLAPFTKRDYPLIEKFQIENDLVKYPELETMSALSKTIDFRFIVYDNIANWHDNWRKIYGEKIEYLENFIAKHGGKDLVYKNGTKRFDSLVYFRNSFLELADYYPDMNSHCHVTQYDEITLKSLEKGYQLTTPYYTLPGKWMVPKPVPGHALAGLYTGLGIRIWLVTFGSILAYTALKYLAKLVHGQGPSMVNSFLSSMALVSMQGIAASKFDILFVVFLMHLSAFYQAKLLSNLFQFPVINDYQTIEEAINNGVEISWSFIAYLFFFHKGNLDLANQYVFDYKRVDRRVTKSLSAELNSLPEAQARYRCMKGPNCATVVAQYETWFADHFGKKVLKQPTHTEYAYLTTSWGHPLVPRFNKVIRRFVESGIPDYCASTQENYFKIIFGHSDAITDGPKPLGLSQLQTLFYVLLVSFALCTVVCVRELRRGTRTWWPSIVTTGSEVRQSSEEQKELQ